MDVTTYNHIVGKKTETGLLTDIDLLDVLFINIKNTSLLMKYLGLVHCTGFIRDRGYTTPQTIFCYGLTRLRSLIANRRKIIYRYLSGPLFLLVLLVLRINVINIAFVKIHHLRLGKL